MNIKRKLILAFLFIISNMTQAQNFDWQGHRGARGLLPENSLPAFKKALELNVSTLELDVVISKDKKVVVSHEPWMSASICLTPEKESIPRDKNHKYNIYEMNYDHIKQFDCGSTGNPGFPEQQKMEVHKPLLRDVFILAEKYARDYRRDEVVYNIEIKSHPEWDGVYHPEYNEFCDLVYATIDAYVPWQRVVIQSFDFRVLKYYHENYPNVTLAVLIESGTDPEEVIDELNFIPEIYSPYYKLLTQRKVKWLHEKGMKVIPWTVNDSEVMKDLIKMKVDGIITDYPDLIDTVNKE